MYFIEISILRSGAVRTMMDADLYWNLFGEGDLFPGLRAVLFSKIADNSGVVERNVFLSADPK